MPAAGKNWMYTSGWPKIQKMCCHSSELPPKSGLKNFMSKLRLSSKNRLPTTSGVNAKMIMNAVTSIAQANNGMRARVMPGVRKRRMEMMISTPAAIAATSATLRPSTQKSSARSGEKSGKLSGV